MKKNYLLLTLILGLALLAMSALPAQAEQFEPYDPPLFSITKTVSPAEARPSCYIDGPDAWPAGTTVGFTAVAGSGWNFDHWEGEVWHNDPTLYFEMPPNDIGVIAVFVPTPVVQHYLYVSADGGYVSVNGTAVQSGAMLGPYPSGTIVNLAATPDSGYYFKNWTGAASGESPNTTVTMDSEKYVFANFEPIPPTQYGIFTHISPAEAGSSCYIIGPSWQYADNPVTLEAVAGTGWVFERWTGDHTSATSTINFNMPPTDVYLNAEFSPSITTNPLTVATNPAGITSTTGSGNYAAGTSVNISAPQFVTINSGSRYSFTGWSGAGITFANPSSASTSMTMPASAATVTANYTVQHYLTVNNGGRGTAGGAGWKNAGTYAQATMTPLAFESEGTRYEFAGWSGDATGSGSPSNTILMNGPKTATATWTTQYYLTVNNGGRGTAGGAGWKNAGTYAQATMTPLAFESEGTRYEFAGWSGDATGSGSPSNTILMNGPKTATATWTTQYFLTVENGGRGTAGGAGWYNAGANAQATMISLTEAGSAGTQYIFAGWSGDATGSGSPSNTILMNGPKTATATWTTQYYLTVENGGRGTADGDGWYDAGANAQATMTPLTVEGSEGTQYVFAGWSGDAEGSGSPSDDILMNGPKTATATWTVQYLITFTQSGLGSDADPEATVVTGSISTPEQTVSLSGNFTSTSFWADSDTTVTYNFAPTVASTTNNKQYALSESAPLIPSPFTVEGPLTITGTYQPQWKVIFDQNGIGEDTSDTIVTIGAENLTAAELPYTTDWISHDTNLSFNYASPVSGDPGTKYVWAVTSGLQQTAQSDTFSVTEAGTVTGYYWKLAVSVDPVTQQYSDLVSFTATLTPDRYTGATAPASVDFFINTLNMGSGSQVTADGVTVWTLGNIPLLGSTLEDMAAGNKTVSAHFSGIDSSPTVPLTVTKENASLEFTDNPISVRVYVDGGNSSGFSIEITVEQADDGNPGHLNNISASDIMLSFKPVGTGGNNYSLAATSFDPATGKAAFAIPQGVLGVETYSIEATLNNNWFEAPVAEDVLCVYDPSLGFTTGGGWFNWPQDGSELAGVKTNFGYTMKYNKKGTGIQGSLLLIAHLEDDEIHRIKSNALYGLALNQDTGIATFSGKCTYTYPVPGANPITVGNQEFMVYVKDNNEPGSGIDQFWFTLLGQSFTLDFNGNKQADSEEIKELRGGNIVVPHKEAKEDSGEIGEKLPPPKKK